MENSQDGPIRGEIVGSGPIPRLRLGATALALAPLLVRLMLWWWGRERSHPVATPPGAGVVEHTDLRLSKRPLGRWKLRVVTTRWIAGPVEAMSGPESSRAGSPVAIRLLLVGIDRLSRWGSQPATLSAARLPPGSSHRD